MPETQIRSESIQNVTGAVEFAGQAQIIFSLTIGLASIDEGLHRRFAEASSALMRCFFISVPFVQ